MNMLSVGIYAMMVVALGWCVLVILCPFQTLTVFGRGLSVLAAWVGVNPRPFTCPHGNVTFCETCVRETVIRTLGYDPNHADRWSR